MCASGQTVTSEASNFHWLHPPNEFQHVSTVSTHVSTRAFAITIHRLSICFMQVVSFNSIPLRWKNLHPPATRWFKRPTSWGCRRPPCSVLVSGSFGVHSAEIWEDLKWNTSFAEILLEIWEDLGGSDSVLLEVFSAFLGFSHPHQPP